MVTTPTRAPSTRLSRRTSSRSVNNSISEGGGDTPSTSSSNPPPPPPPVAMDTEEEEETIPEGTAEEETPTTSSEAQEKVVEEEKMEEEGPSSSTAPAPASPPPLRQLDEEEELIAYAVSMLLTEARKVRDKVAASCEKIKEEGRDYAEAWEAKMKPMIIEQVQKTEKNMALKPLEQLLQDPKHAVIIPPKMTPIREVEVLEQPGPSSSSSNKAMQPIEVKIEDGDGSAAPTTSVLPSTGGGGESNVERAAKREAQVVARINELRKAGLWSNSRLPKCVEPERNKTHWDYLLEEMKWLAVDFKAETANKKKTAKFLAHTIAKLHRDKQIEVARAAEREIKEKKKLCAGIAKMVRGFWKDIDTFVDLKAKEIREVRLQKAKNENLMHMLGHVSEISNVVGEGLVASKTPSIADDKEFEAPGTDSEEEDDEQTIANAEKRVKKDDVKKEVDALQNEANADQDDVILSLPMEYLKSVYGLTEEDVEVMRRNKREADEQKKRPKVVELPDEEEVEDEKMDVDEDPKPSDEPSTSTATTTTTKPSKPEQSQDPGAEDGNGDGRGVLKNVDYQKLNSNDSDERQQELANIAEEALKFMPSGYTLETTHVKTPVPFLIRGTLREYQMVGLDWMVTLYEKNLNGILADEMGLGKTIQTISLIAHLACKESIWGPHLIVVPTSVILNWEMEFKKWCPALKILTYFGTAKERAEKRKGWMKPNCFHVCITSYKTVTQDIRSFKQRAWQYLILDEAQNIKNWKSQRWQALLNVRARRRLLLTGTPLQNSLMELWSLLHFLMPTIFSSHDDFKDWFSNPLTGMMEGNKEMDAPLISRLHNVLRPFILRRLKREVEKQLPEKTEHVVKCSLSKRQRYLYDDFMSRRSTKDNLKSGNMMSVLNIVMQLRKCCNHPNLFEPRPVLAPFVVPRMEVVVPACLIGIQERDSSTDIPEIFNLQKTGYQPQSSTISSQKKPLIVELEAMQQNILQEQRVPEVEGFRFNRTTFVAKNPPRVGEESEDEGGNPRVNGSGSAPGPSNGTIITTPKINGNSSASTPRPPQTSAIRSKTVLNTTPLTINTAHSGFHFNMANQGKNRLDEAARMSPPLKRSKMTGEPVNWADYVPQHVVEKMEESRVNQLEIMRRRFGMMRAPIVPLEMVALIRDEIMSKFPRLVTESDDKIQETLMDHVELLVQRFGMYVEPVLTDAWQCRPTSSGLPYYLRQDHLKFEKDSRALLLESSNRIDTQMTIARGLQFPELRLIEYDCGKLQTLAILLRTLYLMKHRCLIFTQMSKMLDVLQTFLSHHGYQYFRLDGTTGVEQRQAMMERFNADPKIFCFILSTRSGGVGVNLTGADTVIFYDSDWNPTMDAQAQDRCHRIGQTRNVSIYRLISERTIEENILRKAQQKRRLGELAIDEAGFTPEFFKQSDNIRDLFDGENVDIAAPREEFKSDADMEKAMAKCEDEADVNAAKIANAEARLDSVEFRERDEQEEEANEKFKELLDTMRPIERYAVLLLETEYKPDFEEKCKEAEAQIHQKREEWDKTLNGPLLDDDPNGDAIFGADDYYPNGVEELKICDEFDDLMPIWLPPSPPNSDAEFDLRMEDDCLDLMYEIDLMSEARLPQITHEIRRPLAESKKQNQQMIGLTDILISSKEKDSVYDAISKCLQMPPNNAVVAASPAYTENSFSMDDSSQEAMKMMEPLVSENLQSGSGGGGSSGGGHHPGGAPIPGRGDSMSQLMLLQQHRERAKKRKMDGSGRPSQQRQPDTICRATSPPAPIREEVDYDGAEWNVIEDQALLKAVQLEKHNGHTIHLNYQHPGMHLNWELVAANVNKHTRFYRSARQCSIRYQMFVLPKERGQLVASCPITKRSIKVDLSTTELAHLRKGRMTTDQQYMHDYGLITDRKHVNRFKQVKNAVGKRQQPFWRAPKGDIQIPSIESRNLQTLDGGMPAGHTKRLQDFNIIPGQNLDAEADVITVHEELIEAMEATRKKLLRQRMMKPLQPTVKEVRFHTLVLRPYTVPINPNLAPRAARRDMIIAVPPLQAPPPPVMPQIIHPPVVPNPPPQQIQQPQLPQIQQRPDQGLGGAPGGPGGLGGHHPTMHPGSGGGGSQGGGFGHPGGGHQGHQGGGGPNQPLPSIGTFMQQSSTSSSSAQPAPVSIRQNLGSHGSHGGGHHQDTIPQSHHPQPGSMGGSTTTHHVIQQGGGSQGPQGHHGGGGGPSSSSHHHGSMGPGGGSHGGGLSSQQPSQSQQPTIQRRTASVSNVQFMQQGGPPTGKRPPGQSYMVMTPSSSSNQNNQQGGGGGDGPNNGGGGPSTSSQQQGPPQSQQQQRVQYVPTGGARGAYPSTIVMQRGRVVRPSGGIHNGGRLYVDPRPQQYPPIPVRVMPANGQPGQQRIINTGGQRRPPPLPGTVAAVVLPNRGNGGVSQIRTMHLSRRGAYGGPNGGGGGGGGGNQGGGGPQQRINVMMPQNMRAVPGGPGGSGGGGGGQGGQMMTSQGNSIRRQLGVRPLQRSDNPPVAQVVVAPPQGLQGPPVLHMQRSIQMHQQAPPPSQQAPPPSDPSSGGGPK